MRTQVTFDCADPHAQASFWAQVLGVEVEDHSGFVDELVSDGRLPAGERIRIGDRSVFRDVAACRDLAGLEPRLFFQRVPESKAAKNRVHLDIHVEPDRKLAEVERLEKLGAQLIETNSDRGPLTYVLRDPEGNEFCLHKGSSAGTVICWSHSRGERTERMDFASAIIREGDRVTASGRLVRDQTGDWLEPPISKTANFMLVRRVAPAWSGSVRIVGADFGAALAGRFESDGVVEGSATLTGTWAANRLQVERQDLYAPQHREIPNWTVPPCPPPEGGWPHQTDLTFNLGDLRETGAAVTTTIFRPSEDQAVLVVAAADSEAVEAHLRPQLGPLLCVIPSKWTRAELDAVGTNLLARHDEWNVYSWGDTSTENGQSLFTARLTRVLPEIVTWAASLPAGILGLEPWLTHAQPGRI